MGFRLVPKLVTLNDLERRNNRRRALSLLQLSFLLYLQLSEHRSARRTQNLQFTAHCCSLPAAQKQCYPSKSVSSSQWHFWFASRCPGRHFYTWQMIAASCPTALDALCSQPTLRLAWCRKHSAVTATELLQPLDLACGTIFRSSCTIQVLPTDCSDDS